MPAGAKSRQQNSLIFFTSRLVEKSPSRPYLHFHSALCPGNRRWPPPTPVPSPPNRHKPGPPHHMRPDKPAPEPFSVNRFLFTITAGPGLSKINLPGRSRSKIFKRPNDRDQNFFIALLIAFEIFSSHSWIAIEIMANLHGKPGSSRREQPAGISSATVINFYQSHESSRLKFFHRTADRDQKFSNAIVFAIEIFSSRLV